jgi:Ribonuclease E/G family
MTRALFLDETGIERRGVVTLDGRPERLLLERAGEPASLEVGQRLQARLVRREAGLGLTFLAGMGDEPLVCRERLDAAEGETLSMAVVAPPRRDKAAVVRPVADADVAVLSLEARLAAFAPELAITRGAEAQTVADEAEAEALAVEHPLPGGARLFIEPTHALIAVDVDVGGAGGFDPKRSASRVNLTAINATARLLRLKGLGGLVAIDLAGKGGDGKALLEAARRAFAPDEPGVSFGALSRFGVLELALPWRTTPLAERLCEASGAPTPRTLAYRLMRLIEREAGPGARVIARCAPGVADLAVALAPHLAQRIGARFGIEAASDFARDQMEVFRP